MKRGLVIAVLALLALAAAAVWWSYREPGLLPVTASDGPAEPITAAALDTLRGARGRLVSLAGRVEQQGDDGDLVLDDGTGLVRIELSEALPPLVGRGLAVTGWVRERRGAPRTVEALEWMYDSTAAGVRSE